MFRWRIGAAAAVLLAGVSMTTWYAVTPTERTAATNSNSPKQFQISDLPGRATPLYPGSTGNRWVRFTNGDNFPIVVQTVSATVGRPVDSAGKPVATCPATSVLVDPLRAPVTVPGNGTADVALVTHMLATAANACRNLTFPLTYTGTAAKP